jgi:hypothetical protein
MIKSFEKCCKVIEKHCKLAKDQPRTGSQQLAAVGNSCNWTSVYVQTVIYQHADVRDIAVYHKWEFLTTITAV